MEKYLNKGIKEIITTFPKVADILNEYNIGCVPCNVGTCLLKDIVEIHNLPPAEEGELMVRISQAIYPVRKSEISNGVYPGREIKIPRVERKSKAGHGEIKYSPPIKKLVDEHKLIKRLIALIPAILENLDLESEKGRKIVLDAIDFIRSYADKYHHAKEEEILFKYFDENLDILKTMHQDHETGRAHVRATIEAVNKRNRNSVTEHLNGYRELLTEHIKKEDEILYPWMDRGFSITQVGELFSKFNAVDGQFGDAPKKYEELINRLEKKFKPNEAQIHGTK